MAHRPVHPSEIPQVPADAVAVGELYGSAAETRRARERRQRRWRRLKFWRRFKRSR